MRLPIYLHPLHESDYPKLIKLWESAGWIDGWRDYLYHMAVKPDYRDRGIGAKLVNAAVSAIKREGIPKVHCLVKRNNLIAQQFCEACGFELRDELYDYSLR